MKLIILLTLFLNVSLAQWKVEFSANESNQYGQHKVLDTEQEAKDFLIKITKTKKGWRKGSWSKEVVTDLSRMIQECISVDTGEVFTDESGEEFPVFESQCTDVPEYYSPSNWQYKITDITQEVAAEKAKKEADKLKADTLKAKGKDMKLDELIELLELKGVL